MQRISDASTASALASRALPPAAGGDGTHQSSAPPADTASTSALYQSASAVNVIATAMNDLRKHEVEAVVDKVVQLIDASQRCGRGSIESTRSLLHEFVSMYYQAYERNSFPGIDLVDGKVRQRFIDSSIWRHGRALQVDATALQKANMVATGDSRSGACAFRLHINDLGPPAYRSQAHALRAEQLNVVAKMLSLRRLLKNHPHSCSEKLEYLLHS